MFYLNKGEWDGKIIIPESWIIDSTREYVRVSDNKGFGLHWIISKRENQMSFEADGWGGQMISIIPDLDMVVVTKCDEINLDNKSSYTVLNLTIQAASP